jgi:hypothetical protein
MVNWGKKKIDPGLKAMFCNLGCPGYLFHRASDIVILAKLFASQDLRSKLKGRNNLGA